MGRRRLAELFFEIGPHGHRVESYVLTRQARQEQFASILALEERAEHVGNLESTFVIYAGLFVTSKHGQTLTLNPLFSTNFHVDSRARLKWMSTAKSTPSVSYAKSSLFNRPVNWWLGELVSW